MVARNHAEEHRLASWLELFFDLSFVVAVAQAARQLEHSLAAGDPGAGLIGYLIVFGAIWWAWMAFTWFANVFDTDDVPYRLLMMVMIAGSLRVWFSSASSGDRNLLQMLFHGAYHVFVERKVLLFGRIARGSPRHEPSCDGSA